jgi:hypothetical protein
MPVFKDATQKKCQYSSMLSKTISMFKYAKQNDVSIQVCYIKAMSVFKYATQKQSQYSSMCFILLGSCAYPPVSTLIQLQRLILWKIIDKIFAEFCMRPCH